jgi:NADH dehydrogenase [ubiquinone] 1 alpha subcomplex assembly factor 2
MRRIVQYPGRSHPSDVKVSPQWLQWLRHTRTDAPSIAEQSQDVVRQANLKILAAQADKRWNEKASVLDAPGHVRGQPLPALGLGMAQSDRATGKSEGRTSVVDDTTEPESVGREIPDSVKQQGKIEEMKVKEEKEDPWKRAQGSAGEQWQPQAWSGGKAAARR